MIDPGKTAIAVVTCARPGLRLRTVADARRTLPGHRALYVIGNHPDDAGTVERALTGEGDARTWFIPTGRTPEHHGCLAESWNLAMTWAFRDPAVEWLWCLQDDIEVLDGWLALLDGTDADLYLAPAGDMGFLFNRRVLREVGWFDERFRVIGYQEYDWVGRVFAALGESQVVIEDAHGWAYNAVGLRNYWKAARPEGLVLKNEACVEWNKAWLREKWGVPSEVVFWERLIQGNRPRVPEIEWYPWFDRGCA